MNLNIKYKFLHYYCSYKTILNVNKFSDACNLKKFHEIPGPISLPLVGTLYQYLPIIGHYHFDRLHRNGFKKLNKFGPVVRENIFSGVNIVWIFRPEDIQIMYECEGKYPQRRSHLALEKYRLDKPDLYRTGGLLPTKGQEWFRIRSVFQKGLSDLNSVRNFLTVSEQIIQEWINYVNSICSTKDLDYLPILSRLNLELTCMTALDMRLNCFSKQELKSHSRSSKLMRAALATNSCILGTDNGLQYWRKFDTPLYKKLKRSQEYMEEYHRVSFFRQILPALGNSNNLLCIIFKWVKKKLFCTVAQFLQGLFLCSVAVELLSQKMTFFDDSDKANRTVSLLESYLSSPEIDLKDIVGMAADFLLAGIETATYTSSYLFYNIAKNPEAQKKLYEEARQLLPCKNSVVTKNTLANCPYARASLRESFRLNPISVGVGRVLDTDAVFSGYEVPKGTVVVSQNQISCRLEQYFDSPNTYRPERWLKSHKDYKRTHPYLVLPFGHGPRSCIARRLAEQNILTLLLKTSRNFEIDWQGDELDCKSLLINKPDKPVTLILKPRDN